MRKVFTLLVFLSLFSGASFAQGFQGSVIAGLSAAQLYGTDIWGFTKPGIIGGASAQLTLRENNFLRLEMVFIQKGSRKVWKNIDGGTELFSLNINYVQVPIVYVWQFKEKFALDLGASFGVYLNHTLKDEGGYFPSEDPANRPFKPYELAGLAGLGYKLSDKFHLNFRYSNSILPVRSHRFGQTFLLNRGEYNSLLEITLRYILPLGKSGGE